MTEYVDFALSDLVLYEMVFSLVHISAAKRACSSVCIRKSVSNSCAIGRRRALVRLHGENDYCAPKPRSRKFSRRQRLYVVTSSGSQAILLGCLQHVLHKLLSEACKPYNR